MPVVASETQPGSPANEQDLGPLAWVREELRKTMEAAAKALRRYLRENEAAMHGGGFATPDIAHLTQAAQLLHQCTGALTMIEQAAPARMLQAMETASQRFADHPETCTDEAVVKIERASFAVNDFLDAVLAAKPVSAVSLFPQYRDVQGVAGSDRIHPADLWTPDWHWTPPALPAAAQPLAYAPAVRSRFDQGVLKIVKYGDPAAARDLQQASLGLAAGSEDGPQRAFWGLAAAYFEALSLGLVPSDLYAKRIASRVLTQYAALVRGETMPSERLAQDLLFYCARARPPAGASEEAGTLHAVRSAYGVQHTEPVDYEARRFGRFDPAHLAQARKRIAAAAETWSALAGGDTHKFKAALDQFGMVGESLTRLHPDSAVLAQALQRAVDTTARAGAVPSALLAMEVATAVLYLEATYADLDQDDADMRARAELLAGRLDAVLQGSVPEPLQPWMEELYHRVSDRQTMGSVVEELRRTLGDIEQTLDQFFRAPREKVVLGKVIAQLTQMRGVLSVLGLDQASHAVLRMRETVDGYMADTLDDTAARAANFDRLGSSLGALGFLIDMLGYQRALAKKLFVYDEEQGVFRLAVGQPAEVREFELAPNTDPEGEVPQAESPGVELMSQETAAAQETSETSQTREAPAFEVAPFDMLAPEPDTLTIDTPEQGAGHITLHDGPPAAAEAEAEEEAEAEAEADDAPLLQIFVDEARDVVRTGLAAHGSLAEAPADPAPVATLRRAFHTLKGSARMVGQAAFGEAAWSMEELLNTWLAEQRPAEPAFLALCEDALQAFGGWTDDIAANRDGAWRAMDLPMRADALRQQPWHAAPGEASPSQAPTEPAIDPVESWFDPAEADFQDTVYNDPATRTPAEGEDAQAGPAAEDAWSLDLVFPEVTRPLADRPADAADTVPGLHEFMAQPAPTVFPPAVEQLSEVDAAPVSPGEFVESGEPAESVESADPVAPAEPADLADDAEVPTAFDADDNVKRIGSLRIGLPLYNVYLNEADEWSRRLLTELSEWVLELPQPPADSTVGLAHSLSGSSATVGFDALSHLARTLELALGHVQLQGLPDGDANVFLDAGEDIRRLLHQFAAGFLKEPNPAIQRALEAMLQVQAPTGAAPGDEADAADAADAADGAGGAGGSAFEADEAVEADAARARHEDPVLGFFALPGEPSGQVPLQAREDAPVQARASSEPAEQLEPAGDIEPDSQAGPAPLAERIEHADATEESDRAEQAELAPEAGAIAEAEEAEEASQPPLLEQPEAAALDRPTQPDGARRIDDAIAIAVATGSDFDDDIDVLDTIDPDLFPIFDEEAAELLPRLSASLRQWWSQPDDQAARGAALRALHTLKGSARLAGALRLGELAHRLETAIEPLGHEAVQADEIAPLLAHFDALQADLDVLRTVHGQGQSGPVALPPLDEPASAPRASVPVPQALAPRPMAQQSVRVRSQLLDRLVNQAGEVLITRARMEARLGQMRSALGDLTGNLDRLRHQLRDVELQAELQMQSRLAQARDATQAFDPLEFDRFTRVQELTRMMAESVNDVATVQRSLQRTIEGAEDDLVAQGRQARELQHDLLRTRMVQFEAIAERLYGVVRQASKDLGRQVRLDISGGAIELDRGVLDRMGPAFEHLLRNAIVHGIEEPHERQATGKPAGGTITVELHHEANDIALSVQDDGRGLDLPRIQAKALSLGLLSSGAPLSASEAADLIFLPGFSTASQVTELAGRGIGMDVVRAEVQALGGRIETRTANGQGTTFKIVLPLTTAVTQVVMLRAGAQSVGVPTNLVEAVRRVPVAELAEAYASEQFFEAGEPLPFYWAGALLQSSAASQEPRERHGSVLVLRSASQRLALHVDEVLGKQEVVVKNLGPQLSRLPGLAGMSVLASGAVVLIYNPVALATVYGAQARQAQQDHALRSGDGGPASQLPQADTPLVLVVDDSITVRRVTQRLLQREGYRVALAVDGLQALEMLQQEQPAIVLSDIEMPRMDGFDLARNIRADARLQALPIIMITSRMAEKHRQHAESIGVNHYLGKPYSEEELLSLVRRYAVVQPGG